MVHKASPGEQSADATPSIGMIGLGNMGMPMAVNLITAFPGSLTVTARSRDRAESALSAGASWAETPAEVARTSDVVILMVPDLPQVDELLFGEGGVVEALTTCVIVVCSSVSPTGIRATDARLRQQTDGRMRIVDAPVSGGTEGAAAATLSIMVGGTDADVATVMPVLSACGTPVHLGPLGSGDIAKACNQLIVAATMAAVSEASVIAERSGLDLDALLTLLQGGYAGSRVLETKKDRLVARDYSPSGAARYMVKDLSFAHAAAVETGTGAPLLDALRTQFDGLVEAGLGDDDLAVIHRYIRGPE